MKNTKDKSNKLIRTVPYKTSDPKDKVVTTRFTEKEKEQIDNVIQKYGTTLTDFVRNAVFYYINIIENNNNNPEKIRTDIINPESFKLNQKRINVIRKSLDYIEKEMSLIKEQKE